MGGMGTSECVCVLITPSNEPTTTITTTKKTKQQAARLALPVCGMEQEIVEAVTDNDVVVLCGETGSGKSTQVRCVRV